MFCGDPVNGHAIKVTIVLETAEIAMLAFES
jgi:hypothetical protein